MELLASFRIFAADSTGLLGEGVSSCVESVPFPGSSLSPSSPLNFHHESIGMDLDDDRFFAEDTLSIEALRLARYCSAGSVSP